MEKIEDPVTIGVVGSPHGVRGTIRVRATGSGRHIREGVTPVIGGSKKYIMAARSTSKGFLVDLKDVNDREGAAALGGEEVVVDRCDLDDLDEDEFYVADFIGMKAVDGAGELVGEVTEVLENPAHEILVVRSPEKETYVPFTLEHVPEVDLSGRRLVVSPPEA